MGGCLNETLRKIGVRYLGGVTPSLDWTEVRKPYRKVFYYDAILVRRPDEDDNTYSTRVAPKRLELEGIESKAGYHVRTGEAHKSPRRGNEQKMVDIQLAVDALLMASRGLFSSCTLITGDLDFKPLASALVEADSAEAVTIDMVRDWSSEAQRKLLPRPGFYPPSAVFKRSNKLVCWRDDKYRDCYVANDFDGFDLITERSPQQDMRLHITASTMAGLSFYVEEKFSLIVPPASAT